MNKKLTLIGGALDGASLAIIASTIELPEAGSEYVIIGGLSYTLDYATMTARYTGGTLDEQGRRFLEFYV